MIILNSILCNSCQDTIISRSRHDYVTCKCESVSADGGTDYLKRGFKPGSSYTELSVSSEEPFEVIRESFYRGDKGKDGTEPLKWVLLKDVPDSWLDNVIDYNIDNGLEESNKYYLEEIEYRKSKGIKVDDN